ncbi:bifunctional tetrahydrofolate synthase/dihydrofolate synthase, partial [Pseudomonas syringae pv. tagetis]
ELVYLRGLPVLDLPMQNAALAVQAFALLGYPLQLDAIAQVLARTRLAGRLDRRTVSWHGKQLGVLMDVGHNPHAGQFLGQC